MTLPQPHSYALRITHYALPITTAIIIANWNGARHLPGCLGALATQTYRDFAIWVLDNGSTDESLEILRAAVAGDWPLADTLPETGQLPRLHLLAEDENRGFAAGNNIAIRAALQQREIGNIVTLNNDTVADPRWLELMVAALNGDSRIGSVAATMVFAAQPDLVAGAGITVHRDGLALDAGVGELVASLPQGPRPIFGPSAGAALYRRELLLDVGLFDESYFSYLEDADLAWRARLRGWRSVWQPRALVRHEVSATGVQGSPFKNYHLARNRIWTVFKNMPGPLLARWWPYIVRYDLLAVAYGLARRDLAIVRGRRDALAQLPRILAERRAIQARRRVSSGDLARLFSPAPGPFAALAARRAVASGKKSALPR